MKPFLILCGFISSLLMASIVGIMVLDPRMETRPDDEPRATEAAEIVVPKFGRKPCPNCEASSIRVNDELNRCEVCGCEFISAD